ncbi:MAG: hypothetical protein D6681_08950 [Calditrichaeota bacterium]|nr:MAG: hypothetical protein D6681_08950 [Calditrichota bacterium]
MEFRTNLRFYTKVGDFLGQTRPENFRVVNFWDVQSNAQLSYGIADHFDASFSARVYQDVHSRKEANTPDDMFLDLRIGSFGAANNKLKLGALFGLRFPTGEVHNYPFEEYSAGALEYGIHALVSYFNDPFLPHRDFSFHFNVGWYSHNDAGKTLFVEHINDSTVIEHTAGNNATAIRYGMGFIYPTELFNLNLELWGTAFTAQPDSFARSRENFTYLTGSILYKPKWWLHLNLGLDLRVSNDKDETVRRATIAGGALDLPNYPSWKLTLGANFVLSSGTDRIRGGVGGQSDIKKRVDFYERLLQEREKTRSIEEELRRLKREREQAEKELEELRQLLEEEGK